MGEGLQRLNVEHYYNHHILFFERHNIHPDSSALIYAPRQFKLENHNPVYDVRIMTSKIIALTSTDSLILTETGKYVYYIVKTLFIGILPGHFSRFV